MSMITRLPLVAGSIACLVCTTLVAQEKPELPKWEQRAVAFGNDEKANTKQLNDLAADGWEYVGPIAPNIVAYKRLRFGLVYSLELPSEYVTSVAFSPDGKRVIFNNGDGTIRLVEAGTGKPIRIMDHPDVRSVAFTPDGKKAVSVGYNLDRSVRVWDLDTGKEINRFASGFETALSGAAVTPDGKRVLFSTTADKAARLLEIESGKELERFEGHTEYVYGVALSPDGKRSLTCSVDKTVRLWDNESGKELKALEGHKETVFCVAVFPDGKRAVSAGNEREIIIWDLDLGKEIQRLEGSASTVHGLAVSRDGRWIAVGGRGDGGIRILDVKTGKEVCRLEGHKDATYDLAFSPDGRFLVSGGRDKTVKMWRLPKE